MATVKDSGSETAVLSATITDITKANPGVVTAGTHALSTNDTILISGVSGMTEVNDLRFTITVLTSTTFEIDRDTTGDTAYTSGGTVTEIRNFLATVTTAGIYTLVVDTANLADGETLQLYIFGKARTSDTERLQFYASFENSQGIPLKYSPPLVSPHSTRFMLEQTGGTGRAYPWAIYQADK